MWNEFEPDWQVLVLPAEKFRKAPDVPAGFELVDAIDPAVEERLLRSEFEHWEVPFNRRFPGARADSLAALTAGGRVAIMGYIAEENQLGLSGCGELLYVVSDPEFRGRGLYSVFAWHLLNRSRDWGQRGVVLVTNRRGLDDVYERWGGLRIGRMKRVGPLRRRLSWLRDPQHRLRRAGERALADVS